MSFPVATPLPSATIRGAQRLRPMGAMPLPRGIAIGMCDMSPLMEQSMPTVMRGIALSAWPPELAATPDRGWVRTAPRPRLLCDESGRLYEWDGECLAPLPSHQLQQAVREPRTGCRTLFPEPGCPLVVRWNEFRSLLASQLAHPERLREGHRVAVHAQVYEVAAPQSIADLAETVIGDRSRSSEFAILTDTLVCLLGLARRLPPPRLRRPYQHADGDQLMVDERIVRLALTTDPTAIGERSADASSTRPQPAPAPAAAATPPMRTRRESIPQPFTKPWEFKVSREEVLYELTRGNTIGRLVRSWLEALGSRLNGRLEHRRWEALRLGKSLDEQLWSIRPTRRALADRGVRQWASKTLEQAGYNAETMLLEWEIFWRRKLG